MHDLSSNDLAVSDRVFAIPKLPARYGIDNPRRNRECDASSERCRNTRMEIQVVDFCRMQVLLRGVV